MISDLGGAATKNVGTSAGTVAAGDDSRITGAAQKSNNLSDLANAGTARTNLGLAAVAASGAYSDLSGKPSLATVATTGDYSDLTSKPTLGTAAALDVGTGNSQVVQLTAAGKLPAVDGSLLTNVNAGLVAAGTTKVAINYKTADQTFSTTSFTDITGMSFSIGAGETWAFVAFFKRTSGGGNTQTIAINGPASPSSLSVNYGLYGDNGPSVLTVTHTAYDSTGVDTGDSGGFVNVAGVIVNGANAGTVALRSKVVSINHTVKKGGVIIAWKV